MVVDDVVFIKRMGTCVCGIIEQDSLTIGDEVIIIDKEGHCSGKTTIINMEKQGKVIDNCATGDYVGLLLYKNVEFNDIQSGYLLIKQP